MASGLGGTCKGPLSMVSKSGGVGSGVVAGEEVDGGVAEGSVAEDPLTLARPTVSGGSTKTTGFRRYLRCQSKIPCWQQLTCGTQWQGWWCQSLHEDLDLIPSSLVLVPQLKGRLIDIEEYQTGTLQKSLTVGDLQEG